MGAECCLLDDSALTFPRTPPLPVETFQGLLVPPAASPLPSHPGSSTHHSGLVGPSPTFSLQKSSKQLSAALLLIQAEPSDP